MPSRFWHSDTLRAAFLTLLSFTLSISFTTMASGTDFIRVDSDGNFRRGDSIYRFAGTNMWYGPILASDTPAGDMPRLMRELDRLQQLGIDNVRILAGAEGPEGLPHHIRPVLQTSPGVYNDALLTGLDRFMAELERRGMTAVIYLTNAWEWSGGYGSYLQWTGAGPAPVPGIDGYRQYVDHVSRFMLNDSAKAMALDHARFMVSRTNSVTGRPYASSPAVMAWQIANEPRAFSSEGKEKMLEWIRNTARAIKQIDPNHMVSTGSEGKYGCEVDLDLWKRIHLLPEIDYAIIHLWPTNWGWASRKQVQQDVMKACLNSDAYIAEHIDALGSARKPLVIEEFGYPRDNMAFSPDADTSARNRYYAHIFNQMIGNPRIAGVNFWGWNGEARNSAENWKPGDSFMCDPAHEPQGLYGVFDSDSTTTVLIRRTTLAIRDLQTK